jgi:hypothetical protein
MSDLDVIATVTRAGLDAPLGELDLDDGVKFTLGRGLRLGAMTWRREAVESPYVHGRIPVHEVKGAAESALEVYVLGADHATLQANLAELLEAFTAQYEYDLKLLVEGQNYHWRCERADYEVGFITETLMARVLPVRLTFHRHPVPLQGAF